MIATRYLNNSFEAFSSDIISEIIGFVKKEPNVLSIIKGVDSIDDYTTLNDALDENCVYVDVSDELYNKFINQL